MAYAPTTWVDGVTPVNAVNLNKLENGLATLVTLPADTVVAAPTRIIANKLQGADAQPAFRFLGDGKMEWGAGGAGVLDTNLYRSAAGVLKTDGDMKVGSDFYVRDGSAAGQIALTSNGIYFGSALDARLYRHAAAYLRTPGGLVVDNQMYVDYGNAANRLYFGSGGDTYLFRHGAGVLRTDAAFISMKVNATDAAFYAQVTSDTVAARWRVDADGKMNWGPGSAATDISLYRLSAQNLKTNGTFWATQLVSEGTAYVGYSHATPTLLFGTGDTSLYRNGPANLKTDGGFYAVANSGFAWTGGQWALQILTSGEILFADGTRQSTAGMGRSAITITDWNNALLSGIYKGADIANQPPGGGGWYIGQVVEYDGSGVWVTQRAWQMTNATPISPIWERKNLGGAWQPWVIVGGNRDVAYSEHTGNVSFVAGTVDWIINCIFTADGVSSYWIEWWTPSCYFPSSGNTSSVDIYDTVVGKVGGARISGSQVDNEQVPMMGRHRVSPSAGQHNYRTVLVSSGGGGGMQAAGLSPAYLRAIKA